MTENGHEHQKLFRDYFKDLTPEQRATAEHCQLFLEDQGNGFHGLVEGHQVQLTNSGGGYRGFVDGNKPLTSEQAQNLYIKFIAIAKAQTFDRISKINENDPETNKIVGTLLEI
ncbi:MAG: hypothetical protein HZC26_01575 [Candidatus Magasanikbacteria bacterium]|nr:hypothetical protein [Candidatus Magasanikbacteria bacterium]MBI5222571.1 hypothetical protein [Candidatus Magasanikbacteria bacterium]